MAALYEPDGRHRWRHLNVAHKDRAALLWCENATALTGNRWDYLKVKQTEYERLQPTEFADLAALALRL